MFCHCVAYPVRKLCPVCVACCCKPNFLLRKKRCLFRGKRDKWILSWNQFVKLHQSIFCSWTGAGRWGGIHTLGEIYECWCNYNSSVFAVTPSNPSLLYLFVFFYLSFASHLPAGATWWKQQDCCWYKTTLPGFREAVLTAVHWLQGRFRI